MTVDQGSEGDATREEGGHGSSSLFPPSSRKPLGWDARPFRDSIPCGWSWRGAQACRQMG